MKLLSCYVKLGDASQSHLLQPELYLLGFANILVCIILTVLPVIWCALFQVLLSSANANSPKKMIQYFCANHCLQLLHNSWLSALADVPSSTTKPPRKKKFGPLQRDHRLGASPVQVPTTTFAHVDCKSWLSVLLTPVTDFATMGGWALINPLNFIFAWTSIH